MRRFRGAGRAVEISALVLVALSPFIVYRAFRASDSQAVVSPWPGDVAVADLGGTAMRSLYLLNVDSRPGEVDVIRWPAQALLQIPNVGDLRAVTAFGIGGARLLAEGIEGTYGVPVPWYAQVDSTGGLDEATIGDGNLGSHAAEVEAFIRSHLHPRLDGVDAPGAWSADRGVRTFVPSVSGFARALRGILPTPTPKPTKTLPPINPAKVRVDVFNAGAPAGSGRTAAAKLRKAKFVVTRIADFRTNVRGTVVLYRADRRAAEAVAKVLGVKSVAPLKGSTAAPKGFSTRSDVVIVIGPAPRPTLTPVD